MTTEEITEVRELAEKVMDCGDAVLQIMDGSAEAAEAMEVARTQVRSALEMLAAPTDGN